MDVASLILLYGTNPSAYSLSPHLWNPLLARRRIAARYETRDLGQSNEARFKEELDKRRGDKDFLGANVTVNYKEVAWRLVDARDRLAERLGVVNTIKKVGSKLVGYNTDGYGLVAALSEAGVVPHGKRFIIIGAGGATPAIVFALAEAGAARVDIRNRTAEKAQRLAEKVRALYKNVAVTGGGLAPEDLAEPLKAADVIVNTTSLGMRGENENAASLTKEEMEACKSGAVFADIVYAPLRTRFLEQARQLDYRTVTGEGMLMWQAVKAAEIILDTKLSAADVEVMRRGLMAALSRQP